MSSSKTLAVSGYQNSHQSRNVALKTPFSIPFFFMLKGPTFCRSHYFYINISEVPTIYLHWQQKSLNFNSIKNLSSCLIPIHPVCQNLRSRLFATFMVCQMHSNKADISFPFFFFFRNLLSLQKSSWSARGFDSLPSLFRAPEICISDDLCGTRESDYSLTG